VSAAAADVMREAIETVCKDDEFLIPSPEAAADCKHTT